MHNSISFVTVKRQFSDYRMMGNIAVPFTIQESLNSVDAVQNVTVNSIQFGTTLPDSEFSIQP